MVSGPMKEAGVFIVLSEEDYVCARPGNRREDYRAEVAQAAKCPWLQAEVAIHAFIESSETPAQLLVRIREFMILRYEEALRAISVN
jgi:hypothetical protein